MQTFIRPLAAFAVASLLSLGSTLHAQYWSPYGYGNDAYDAYDYSPYEYGYGSPYGGYSSYSDSPYSYGTYADDYWNRDYLNDDAYYYDNRFDARYGNRYGHQTWYNANWYDNNWWDPDPRSDADYYTQFYDGDAEVDAGMYDDAWEDDPYVNEWTYNRPLDEAYDVDDFADGRADYDIDYDYDVDVQNRERRQDTQRRQFARDGRSRRSTARERSRNNERRERRPQVRQLTAELVSSQRMSPPGVDHDYVAAVVRTNDGRRLNAALGAAEKIDDLDLQAGDRLRLTGHVISVRGRPLFVAHRLQTNDQTVALDHRQMRRGRERQVSGEIIRKRDISLAGVKQPMTVALLETPDGRRVVSNLGAADQVSELDLQQGDRIQVTGHTAQIHDDPVLIAHRISAGDEQIDVDHQDLPITASQSVQRLSATIQKQRRVNPPGLPTMIVAQVETDEGQRVVNLGAADKVSQLNLEQGDEVELEGRQIRLHNKPIFIAHEIRKGDQRVGLDHRSLEQRGSGQVAGTIQRMKKIQPTKDAPQMVAALIRREDGTKVSANLGPAQRIEQLNLSEGDRVNAQGRFIEIHDQPVFVAHELQSGDQRVNLMPKRQLGFRGDQPRDRRRPDQRRRSRTEAPGGLGVWLDPEEDVAGARIVAVEPRSPAAAAGLREGDIVTTIGDEYVDTGDEVAELVSGFDPGERIRLVVRRNGRQFTTTARLSTRSQALDRTPQFYDLDEEAFAN